ncbi:LysR family transcriptional regulator [Marinomonas sp. 15G1-11]|uniref:LysR family transcriptional regulator n=1 Tax=Marinomonas phaeophyticola TaxID=3004091 RepID=A0ABT4JZG1_9GAMM|nr:LysR family transcriptional regulator [Marinomonas sp. 15G1-11]MCZ2723168.1 LysR family transcriptional regulator [Marinomonas sp. 15G1-11]
MNLHLLIGFCMDMAARLELFIDIVQQGNFSKGAALHNMERSIVSKQIKALEADLGVRLLNRSTRSLSLTDAGKEIYKQAEIVRDALINTRKVAESFHSEPKGVIRVTSYTVFGQLYLRKAINIFMKRYPKTSVELVLDDRRLDIIGEQFDVTFRIGPLKDSSFIVKKIGSISPVILASETFIQEYGLPETLEELLLLPAISYANNELNLNKITISETPSSQKVVKRNMLSRFKANDVKSLISAIEEGIGYSIVPLSNLEGPIKEKGLVPLLTDYKLIADADGIYVAYPHRNPAPMVKLLIETVQEVIGTPPIWETYIENYLSYYQQ